MNSDSKIFSKIFATRLSSIISKIIHPRQHGFIPGRGTTEHVRRVITLFDAAAVSGDPVALILLDAEKAFNRFSWDYLWSILEHRGVGKGCIKAIMGLYKKPVARIKVNGEYTDIIHINRGTRQGCPCYPLLFALYIDPLIRQIESSQAIKPTRYHTLETKILAYADDLAIVTPEPQTAIMEIVKEENAFGLISGYKLNPQKTQVVINSKTGFTNTAVTNMATYLGVKITSDLAQLVMVNISPIIKQGKRDFDRWHNLHITIVGR